MACIFCDKVINNPESYTVYRDEDIIVFLDKFPRTKGHICIAPVKHFRSESDLTLSLERRLLNEIVDSVSVMKKFGAKGITFGANFGAAAGQQVQHIHMHIIPRENSHDAVELEPAFARTSWRKKSLNLTNEEMQAVCNELKKFYQEQKKCTMPVNSEKYVPENVLDNECPICDIALQSFHHFRVYKDDSVVVFLDKQPRTLGHICVAPTTHFQGFSEMSQEQAQHILSTVVDCCRVLNEFGAQGINIAMNDGDAAGQEFGHNLIHVIPRFEPDDANEIDEKYVNIPWRFNTLSISDEQLYEIGKKLSSLFESWFEKKNRDRN